MLPALLWRRAGCHDKGLWDKEVWDGKIVCGKPREKNTDLNSAFATIFQHKVTGLGALVHSKQQRATKALKLGEAGWSREANTNTEHTKSSRYADPDEENFPTTRCPNIASNNLYYQMLPKQNHCKQRHLPLRPLQVLPNGLKKALITWATCHHFMDCTGLAAVKASLQMPFQRHTLCF